VGILGEITEKIDQNLVPWVGLPHLPEEEIPTCGAWPLCNRTGESLPIGVYTECFQQLTASLGSEFFEGILKLPPSFKPWATPAYSNIAYQLLAYSLESIVGKPYPDILNDTVLKPLDLQDTYYWYAPEKVGILPGSAADTWWYAILGESSPSGNMYASAGDLSKLGLAILKSTLLKPIMTRRWLKPIAFSADLYAAVGIPWGIRRIPANPNNHNKILTAFNKAGSFRWYGSLLTLIPEWNMGFTIMLAGNITGSGIFGFADYLSASLLPAYQAVARADAHEVYGGTYVADPRRDPVTNQTMYPSSITIRADDTKPGLYAAAWISNGVDMVDESLRLASGINMKGYRNEVRLYYTGLTTKLRDGGRKMSFKAIFEDTGFNDTGTDGGAHLFTTDCAAWLQFTGATYGHLPLDEFIFELDAEGNTVAVENVGLRVTMKKKSSAEGSPASSPGVTGGVPKPGQGSESPGEVVPQPGQESAEPPGQAPEEGKAEDEKVGGDDGGSKDDEKVEEVKLPVEEEAGDDEDDGDDPENLGDAKSP